MPSSYEKYPREYGRKQAERIQTLEAEVERLKTELRNHSKRAELESMIARGWRPPGKVIYRCEKCGHLGVASSDASMGPSAILFRRRDGSVSCRRDIPHGLCEGLGRLVEVEGVQYPAPAQPEDGVTS